MNYGRILVSNVLIIWKDAKLVGDKLEYELYMTDDFDKKTLMPNKPIPKDYE